MKFGKDFQTYLEETLPEWRDKYLCYKPLKKFIKNIPSSSDAPILDTGGAVGDGDVPTGSRSSVGLEEWFVRILNEELEKFNDFYENKDEEFVIRLQELKGRIEKVKEKSCKDGVLTLEIKRSEEILNIRKDYVAIHGEIILLKNYSSLNFAGLVKILKKYDKRTGEMLSLPFTKRALHQPFFTTEPLTGLIRECEANLELLCPFEPEVIESILSQRDQMDPPSNDTRVDSEEAPPSLGEETIDIYRSTLAAIRTIHSLRKKSSTYNPLSFSSFLRSQEEKDDSTGAITAESLGSNSSAGLQNEEGAEKGDAHSYK